MIPEQSPATYPSGSLHIAARKLDELYALGFPTECDGDTLAVLRGPLSRLIEVVS